MEVRQQLHPVFTDPLFIRAKKDAEALLNRYRFFLESPKRPIYDSGVNYTKWVCSLGIPKKAVKWLAPMWVNAAPRNITYAIFGRDSAPIAQLGDRSVSAFIRFLLFDRGMSLDGIRHKLIDQMGYNAKSARPLVYRIAQDLDKARNQYESNHERELFKDLVSV